jgi:hypothetical protein
MKYTNMDRQIVVANMMGMSTRVSASASMNRWYSAAFWWRKTMGRCKNRMVHVSVHASRAKFRLILFPAATVPKTIAEIAKEHAAVVKCPSTPSVMVKEMNNRPTMPYPRKRSAKWDRMV